MGTNTKKRSLSPNKFDSNLESQTEKIKKEKKYLCFAFHNVLFVGGFKKFQNVELPMNLQKSPDFPQELVTMGGKKAKPFFFKLLVP